MQSTGLGITVKKTAYFKKGTTMLKLRLRTKFLLALLLVSSSITCATLWMVRRSVGVQLRKEIAENLLNAVVVFRNYQRQREIGLASSAELLANLPSLKALMTTRDAATIQDASADIWRLAPSDVFVLADPAGRVMAVHTKLPGITRSLAKELLKKSLGSDQPSYWWYGAGHLYQVFLQPVYTTNSLVDPSPVSFSAAPRQCCE